MNNPMTPTDPNERARELLRLPVPEGKDYPPNVDGLLDDLSNVRAGITDDGEYARVHNFILSATAEIDRSRALSHAAAVEVGEVVASGHAIDECVAYTPAAEQLPIGAKLCTTPPPAPAAVAGGEDASIAAAFREVSSCSYAQDGVAGELFSEVRKRAALMLAPKPATTGHRWNEEGERCLNCGDKDWFAGSECSGKRAALAAQPAAGEVCETCDRPTRDAGAKMGLRPVEMCACATLATPAAQRPGAVDVEARWASLLADCDAVPCKYPCLRDDLHDWLRDYDERTSRPSTGEPQP